MGCERFQNCGNVFKNCCRGNRTFGAVLTIVANVLTIVASLSFFKNSGKFKLIWLFAEVKIYIIFSPDC
jgi:hypothetical protein